MLIPFGVFSAAGAGTGATGAYELISTAYGTGSSGTITFSSIPQNFKHLQIRATVKSTSTTSSSEFRFNGVTGTNYASHYLQGNGSAVSSSSLLAASHIRLSATVSATTTANAYSGIILDVLDYASTTKNKTIKSLAGLADASTLVALTSGFLSADTSAISSLTITTATGGGGGFFTTGSRFSLYGIRG